MIASNTAWLGFLKHETPNVILELYVSMCSARGEIALEACHLTSKNLLKLLSRYKFRLTFRDPVATIIRLAELATEELNSFV